MSKVIEVVGTAIIAGSLFVIPTLIVQPLPIPSLTSLAGGLLGFWLTKKRRYTMMSVGVFGGAVVGIALHVYQHYVEDRLDIEGGLLAHLGLDAAIGLGVAGMVLTVAFVVYRVIERRLTPGPEVPEEV